jgi:hypothetical protein
MPKATRKAPVRTEPHQSLTLPGASPYLRRGSRVNLSYKEGRQIRCFQPLQLQGKEHLLWLTQGEPWAKFSCPFGAVPPGCMTGAKNTYAVCPAFLFPSV